MAPSALRQHFRAMRFEQRACSRAGVPASVAGAQLLLSAPGHQVLQNRSGSSKPRPKQGRAFERIAGAQLLLVPQATWSFRLGLGLP